MVSNVVLFKSLIRLSEKCNPAVGDAIDPFTFEYTVYNSYNHILNISFDIR